MGKRVPPPRPPMTHGSAAFPPPRPPMTHGAATSGRVSLCYRPVGDLYPSRGGDQPEEDVLVPISPEPEGPLVPTGAGHDTGEEVLVQLQDDNDKERRKSRSFPGIPRKRDATGWVEKSVWGKGGKGGGGKKGGKGGSQDKGAAGEVELVVPVVEPVLAAGPMPPKIKLGKTSIDKEREPSDQAKDGSSGKVLRVKTRGNAERVMSTSRDVKMSTRWDEVCLDVMSRRVM